MDGNKVNKVRADGSRIEEEKKKNKRRIAFMLAGIIVIVIVMGAYIYEYKYGTLTLHPGEHYIVNIPFIGASNNPVIEGYATYTNGTPIKNVNVTVKYKGEDTVLAWNLTDKNGYYRIVLPEINTTSKKYDIYVGYDNTTNLTLANHDYALNLHTDKDIYNKSTDTVVVMTGTIDNEDARIKNGRMDVNLKYHNITTKKWVEIFGYKRYYINAEPQENYIIPNEDDGVNITWQIPSNASIGKYKFYVKTSFNAKERTKSVYFNITE